MSLLQFLPHAVLRVCPQPDKQDSQNFYQHLRAVSEPKNEREREGKIRLSLLQSRLLSPVPPPRDRLSPRALGGSMTPQPPPGACPQATGRAASGPEEKKRETRRGGFPPDALACKGESCSPLEILGFLLECWHACLAGQLVPDEHSWVKAGRYREDLATLRSSSSVGVFPTCLLCVLPVAQAVAVGIFVQFLAQSVGAPAGGAHSPLASPRSPSHFSIFLVF